jgi:hypothetical protein
MIKVVIKDGICDCDISGDPRALAAELIQAENAVIEKVGKIGMAELVVFNITYHAISKTIADVANGKANLKSNCDNGRDCDYDKQ